MSSSPESKPDEQTAPFIFERNPENSLQLLKETDELNIGGAFGPASSPEHESTIVRRHTFERIRAVTGKSIESYIGKYRYYIGQSKYYNKKTPDDEREFGKEIDDFFSQETDEDFPEQMRGSIYLNPSSTQKAQDYLKNQVTSIIKSFADAKEEAKDHYDIIGVPSKEGMERQYCAEYMANSILSALTLMQSKKAPPTLNFPTNVRFFNLIVYFRDVPDELDANISLPQTAITIIGNTLKELIINNKSWIITDGSKQPFANLLGDALIKAKKREKELTESLRKRLHLTGILLKKVDEKGKRREINFESKDPPPDLFPLTVKEQKQLDEVISPYSGMTIWLAIEKLLPIENLKEKVIWHISQLLRIPAVVVSLEQPNNIGASSQFKTNKLRVEVLYPNKHELPEIFKQNPDNLEVFRDPNVAGIEKWTTVFDLQTKRETLHKIILEKADAYFDLPNIDFTRWNTITPSIFLRSAESVNKRLDSYQPDSIELLQQPVDAKIIDRTIRYALIFGNRDVVETIINSTTFQKIVLQRREKIVEDIFLKASQEVYIFSRVILAILKVPNFNFGSKYDEVRNFLRKFLENIFGKGFIWDTPSGNVMLERSHGFTHPLDEQLSVPEEKAKLSTDSTPDEEREDKELIKRASRFFFPEYVFVWSILCLKFDVSLLFLEYSGVHRQDFQQDEVYQTDKGIYQIGNALAAARILKGMSQLLKEDTSISKEEHETMNEHSAKYENIAIGLLNEALTHGTALRAIFEQKLPFWGDITLINLGQQAELSNFFSERSITRHVNNEWEGLNRLTTKSDKDVNLLVETVNNLKSFWKPDSMKFLLKRVVTPRNTFFFHVSFYILFLFMLILLICFYWRNDQVLNNNNNNNNTNTPTNNIGRNRDIIFIIFMIYVITNFVDEIYQYKKFLVEKFENKRKSNKKGWEKVKENGRVFKAALVEYLNSIWNLLDLLIVIGFIIAVVTYYIFRNSSPYPNGVDPFQNVRIYFGLFSTLFYFRFFQYILIFPGIGPLVYTCFLAFKRMLYFLIIIVLVALCFGIAEVALTTTPSENSTTTTSGVTRQLIVYMFYPYYQIFGEYFLDEFENDSFLLISLSNTSKLSIFGSESNASFWLTTQILTYIAIMVWILIANVLLLNLMIAYFSQIYEEVSKNAASIYLLNFLEIVNEYKDKSFFPPPFNLITYTYRIVSWCIFSRHKKQKHREVRTSRRRQTEVLLKGMMSRRHFLTRSVAFGWHFELSFADSYWKRIGEERYAEKAAEEKDNFRIEQYLESRGMQSY